MFTVKAFENQCRNAITSCSFSVRVTSHGGRGGGGKRGQPVGIEAFVISKVALKIYRSPMFTVRYRYFDKQGN